MQHSSPPPVGLAQFAAWIRHLEFSTHENAQTNTSHAMHSHGGQISEQVGCQLKHPLSKAQITGVLQALTQSAVVTGQMSFEGRRLQRRSRLMAFVQSGRSAWHAALFCSLRAEDSESLRKFIVERLLQRACFYPTDAKIMFALWAEMQGWRPQIR